MPLQKLQLRPGLNREGTNYSNEGGFYDGDKIRFRSGFPEKLGGWVRLGTEKFLGVARSMWNWSTLAGANLLGIGTNLKYYIEYGGVYNDITPIVNRQVYNNTVSIGFTTLVNTISATDTTFIMANALHMPPQNGIVMIGSEQIFYNILTANTATDCVRGYNNTTAASHLANANVSTCFLEFHDTLNLENNGDFLILSNVTTIDGIPAAKVNCEHQAYKYDTNYFYTLATTSDINLSNLSFSTSVVTNAGGNNITVDFENPVGLAIYTIGTGWGAGPWSRGTWGSAYNLGVGVGQQLRLWTNDNYGQDLVIAPRGGEIFYWNANDGVTSRAKSLAALANTASYSGQFVPNNTNQVISSSIQRFVIAMGANSYDATEPDTPFDPMLVRWSDQENPYQWVPEVTNQSGEQRLTNGSYIVSARNTRQEILIWTDSAIYSMQYLGPPYVWGFQLLMDNISIISPNAAITINNVTYWMGTDKFYMYSGRVETLPCALRQYIFADINKDQAWQITTGGNEGYNEVWWLYCSSQSNKVNKYVIYNYLDRVWYYGSIERSAWLDSGIRLNPMAAQITNQTELDQPNTYPFANPMGQILYHEVGNDDASGLTPVAIPAYVQSSDFDIGDGHNFGFIWRMLPDVNFNGSSVNQPSVQMELQPRYNSGTGYGSSDNPTVTSSNNYSVYPQYTVQEFTGQVYTRLRARQMAFKISSDGIGVAWQLGSPRIDIKPDGRR